MTHRDVPPHVRNAIVDAFFHIQGEVLVAAQHPGSIAQAKVQLIEDLQRYIRQYTFAPALPNDEQYSRSVQLMVAGREILLDKLNGCLERGELFPLLGLMWNITRRDQPGTDLYRFRLSTYCTDRQWEIATADPSSANETPEPESL